MKTLSEYAQIQNGPGKFEGESGLANYLWDLSCNGDGEVMADAEEAGHFACAFDLTSEERDVFAYTGERRVVLVEDSQGFVTVMPRSRYARWAGIEIA